MRLAWGTVVFAGPSADGIQALEVIFDPEADESGTHHSPSPEAPASTTSDTPKIHRAIAYSALCPHVGEGDRVLVNRTATDLALGTGGIDFVVATSEQERVSLDRPAQGGGHIMKLRYTPLQLDVLSVESQESPHHEVMAAATDTGGMPVVCCDLHSQVPLVAAAAKAAKADLTIAYCMSDQAALPYPFSDLMHNAKKAGLIDISISAGQAFGADIEAVTTHSALLAAKHVAGADMAIVAVGPGITGTGTPFGHGGIAVGEAINAAAVTGSIPVVALRTSFADARSRHRGVSHHTLFALSRIALAEAVVAIPTRLSGADGEERLTRIKRELHDEGILERHTLREMDLWGSEGVQHDRKKDSPRAPIDLRGIEVRSMGRVYEDDPTFFEVSFAAGIAAARLVEST